MESRKAQHLLRKYARAVACVEVRTPARDLHSGSAFHVGEGVFVTARHVLENNQLVGLHLPVPFPMLLSHLGEWPTDEQLQGSARWPDQCGAWGVDRGGIPIISGPHYHEDERVDVAVLKVDLGTTEVPYIVLGRHLDDWTSDSAFLLSEAIVLGYPPIPMTAQPQLFAARAEINAIVIPYHTHHCSFILSSMPRGGFSGGVAISEHDFALGMVVHSLGLGGQPAELGFLTVLSVEQIFVCLAQAKLLPKVQREGWGDFWNSAFCYLADEDQIIGRICAYDDGERVYVEVESYWGPLVSRLLSSAKSSLSADLFDESQPRGGCWRWTPRACSGAALGSLAAFARVLLREAREAGLRCLCT